MRESFDRRYKKLFLNEQQTGGGVGNMGNVWQYCGISTPSAFPWAVYTGSAQYGDIVQTTSGVNGYYLGIPNYWVPERCNDQLCTASDVGGEFTVNIKPNHTSAGIAHFKLISVGSSTPTVNNVCDYGMNPPSGLYNCPHYYNNFVTGNCLPNPGYGCTNPNATNYNPVATVDDGSCVLPISGCTNPNATNYDPLATVDDGSCNFNDICHKDFSFTICQLPTNNTNNFVVGTSTVVWQSNSQAACLQCNGSMCMTSDIGQSFEYPTQGPTPGISGMIVVLDSFSQPYFTNTGTIDNMTTQACPPPEGCTNPLATNYDPLAVIDDGSCIVYGCTDIAANNYDPTATIDDGSCTYDPNGCTNPTATNFDPLAIVDDGSCYWSGCADPNATPCSQFPPAIQNSIQCYESNHDGCGTPADPNDTSCCNYTVLNDNDIDLEDDEDCQPPPGGCPPLTLWNPYPNCACVMVSYGNNNDNEIGIDIEKEISDPIDCTTNPVKDCWSCHGNPQAGGSCWQAPLNWITTIGIPQGFNFYNTEVQCVSAGPDCVQSKKKKKNIVNKKLQEEIKRIKDLLK